MATLMLSPATGARDREVGFGPRFVAAVSIGSMLNPINSSIIAIALVSIGHAFGVGAASTTWLVSALYLATAIGQPTMGRLADRLGPRRVYLAGSGLVAAGGLIGAVGVSLSMLVAARIVIGLGTSAAYPAAMAMVRRQSERLRREAPGSVLGALAIAGQATMAVGPPLGGLLITLGGWRLTFLINLPLALIGAILALIWLPRDEPPSTRAGSLDPGGLALFASMLTGLLIFVMNLTHPRWWLLGVTVALLAVLIRWELREHAPFVDIRMLAHNRALTTTYLRYGVTMLITYCFIYGWTLWLEQAAGKSASATGLLMMPSFVVAAAVSALASRRRRVWGPLMIGTIALTAGSVSLTLLSGSASLGILVAVSLVFGVQNGLTVVTNQAAMYAQAPPEQTGTAAGLMRTFMYIGAIFSASLISLTFGQWGVDVGLHRLALILTAASVTLLIATTFDRSLRHGVRDRK
jgi:MFS family permease